MENSTERTHQYGHDAGIIHRDWKPQNILMQQSSDGETQRPVVLDFGLYASTDSTVATTTRVAGTPRSIAPEKVMFANRQSTPKSHLSSLGMMLDQMLTGTTPASFRWYGLSSRPPICSPVEPR